jgi:hypothetical protein
MLGGFLATSYSDAVCSDYRASSLLLPAAGIVLSFLPNILFIMDARPLPGLLAPLTLSLSPVLRGTEGNSHSQTQQALKMPDC